jgi:hypothetical protein
MPRLGVMNAEGGLEEVEIDEGGALESGVDDDDDDDGEDYSEGDKDDEDGQAERADELNEDVSDTKFGIVPGLPSKYVVFVICYYTLRSDTVPILPTKHPCPPSPLFKVSMMKITITHLPMTMTLICLTTMS